MTGGFKVWHIVFIIIAFIVTIIVVYCCFHRCRIPRTKQEIEADLMRTNITNKFRDYLSEFPNEPTTFIEALKRVQEIEEKSEKDDAFVREASARKRRGWLKLKGGKNDAKEPPDKISDQQQQQVADDKEADPSKKPAKQIGEAAATPVTPEPTKTSKEEQTAPLLAPQKPINVPAEETTGKLAKPSIKKPSSRVKRTHSKDTSEPHPPAAADPRPPTSSAPAPVPAGRNVESKPVDAAPAAPDDTAEQRAKPMKRRRHKPNLSRTRRTGEVDLEKGVNLDTSEAPTPAPATTTTTTRQHVHRVRMDPDV